MDIRIGSGMGPLFSQERSSRLKPREKQEEKQVSADRVELSARAKAEPGEDPVFSRLETLQDGAVKESLTAQVREWRQSCQLEVNWNATVDPDGSIYAKSYVEGLVNQYEEMRAEIEDYYREGHEENLRFSNPYNHLVEKYQLSGSPYFRGDMGTAQREMAFRQERALLWGGRVVLNDPWALGGRVPKGEEIEQAAKDYAQSVLDGLIEEYKKAQGLV